MFNEKMYSVAAASVFNSVRGGAPKEFTPFTSYNVGDSILFANRIYVVVNQGQTGAAGPTHFSGTGINGSVTLLFMRLNDSLTDIVSNYYLGISEAQPWDNNESPPAPGFSDSEETLVKDQIFTLIKLFQNNLRLAVAKNNWVTETIYTQYSDEDVYNVENSYVIVDNENIYLCLYNNNGATSVVKPTGRSSLHFHTADGYTWKYIGSISAIDFIQYATENYVPINKKLFDDGSEQWTVQATAAQRGIGAFKVPINVGVGTLSEGNLSWGIYTENGSGADVAIELNDGDVVSVRITEDPGANGINYSARDVIAISDSTEPGVGASIGSLTIVGGQITAATDTTPGSAYNNATVLIIGDGSGASISTTIESGSITQYTVTNSGSGYTWAKAIVVPGTAGAIAQAIVAPPRGHGADIITDLKAHTLLFSFRITNENAPYITDCNIRQLSLMTNVQPIDGSPKNSQFYAGPQHPNFETLDKYNNNSGNIVYVQNIPLIEHSGSQEEIIRIALSFKE